MYFLREYTYFYHHIYSFEFNSFPFPIFKLNCICLITFLIILLSCLASHFSLNDFHVLVYSLFLSLYFQSILIFLLNILIFLFFYFLKPFLYFYLSLFSGLICSYPQYASQFVIISFSGLSMSCKIRWSRLSSRFS